MSDGYTRKGNMVVGLMLVVIGLSIALARAGVITWTGPWTLWPLILMGIGLARFVQSPPGAPKEGLLFLTGGLWLFVAEAGWVPLSDSWPLLIIAFGLIIALNAGRRSPRLAADAGDGAAGPGAPGPGIPGLPHAALHHARRRERSLTPLAVIGIWIAIVVAAQVSGVGSFTQSRSGDRLHVVSVMGRSEHTSQADRFRGADITNVMGRSELDLRAATIPPGGQASVEVFSMMGAVVVRVPPGWTVDTRALPTMGAILDQRFPVSDKDAVASTGPAPRLVLRGLVLMGRLVIAS